MTSRKGFTLIELMVVVFIVGILAAVAIPIMRGRIDAAKWSEGRAAMGSIRTAARAYCAENGPSGTYDATVTLAVLGFVPRATSASGIGDLDGKYFTEECYAITWNGYDDYDVACTAASAVAPAEPPTSPSAVGLDETGLFTETP